MVPNANCQQCIFRPGRTGARHGPAPAADISIMCACVGGDYLRLLKRLQPAAAQKRTPQQLTREMNQDRFVETNFYFIESKYATTIFRHGFQDKCVDLSVT